MTIVGLLALTDSRARKTGNPYGTIYKQVRAVGFVGADYELAVNREAIRQEQSATFQGESLPWGQWLIPHKVIQHNGKLYLRTQTTPGNRQRQAAKVICYRDTNGKFLARDDVKPFLPVVRESAKQQNETGIDKTVWVRTYAFDSIQKIRIAGTTYKLVPDTQPKLGDAYKDNAKEFHPTSPQWENQVESKSAKPNRFDYLDTLYKRQ